MGTLFMPPDISRSDTFIALQKDIVGLQESNHSNSDLNLNLGPISLAFPNSAFPLGAIHEFIAPTITDAAPASAFISGLLKSIVSDNCVTIWISSARKLFTPSLKYFGLHPDNIIFIDLQKEKDVAWAVDEALKCNSISAVVAELREIDFITSRKLQLAVEKSGVTGFILLSNTRNLRTTACAARWQIKSLPSEPVGDLPGIGFPKWRVELLKVRNGKPGLWNVKWVKGKFEYGQMINSINQEQQEKTG